MATETLGAKFTLDITELKANLADANRKIRESESQFREAAAGMDDWTDSEAGLIARHEAHSKQLDIQRGKVKSLIEEKERIIKKMEEEGASEDDIARAKDNLNKLIEKESKQLDRLRGSLEKSEKALEDFRKDTDEAGDSADDAADNFEGLEKASDTANKAIAGVAAAAVAAVGSLIGLAESTREIRTAMSKLETSFEGAGLTAEDAEKAFVELSGVLGDADKATETAAFLAQMADSQKELSDMTHTLTGVYATFGDSLPVEGLAEAVNHTANLGTVQGNLADALEWSGINVDDFNAELEKCNTTEERQEKILETLDGLYGDAADAYKTNAKEVIKANEAQAEYNLALAELGETIEPVATELKTTATKALKTFMDTLKKKGSLDKFTDGIEDLAEDVLPALADVLAFVIDNFETISGTLLTVTGLVKGLGAASAIGKLVTGLKEATGAMGALNAVMKNNVFGLVISAVGLLVGGIGLLTGGLGDAKDSTKHLSDEQYKAIEAAEDAAEAYREAKDAATELAEAELANIDNTQKLWGELQTLVDENGKVKDSDKARAEFILGELNNALGTEYTLNDNIIEQYGEMKKSIEDVIETKKAQILLEAYEETYTQAIQNRAAAEEARALAVRDYSAQLAKYKEKEAELEEARAAYQIEIENAKTEAEQRNLIHSARALQTLETETLREKGILDEKQAKYNETEETLNGYYADISSYEQASTLMLQGETDKAIDILETYSGGFATVANTAKLSADEQKKVLSDQVINTRINAELMRKAYEDGVEGVTKDMVDTAEEQAKQAETEFLKLGENITEGIAEGAESKKLTLSGALQRLVDWGVKKAKEAMESKSPSKLFAREVGAPIPQGIAVGVEDGTGEVVSAIRKQVDDIENAYDLSGVSASVSKGFTATNKTNGSDAVASGSKSVVINQTNNYSQQHSRYELYKSKQQTAAAVRAVL